MTPEIILSLILQIGPQPGRTPYSVVEAEPEGQPPCADTGNLMCRKPWRDISGNWGLADRWVRYEQPNEAIARWWTIARALSDEGAGRSLTLATLTVMQHESGFRRDVHAGVGTWSRGDGGRSHCLGQIMLGKNHPEGFALTGVDYGATRRCVGRVVRHLRQAMGQASRARTVSGQAVFANYGGGPHLIGHPYIVAREGTMQRYLGANIAKQLPAWAVAVVEPLAVPAAAAHGCTMW